VVLHYIKFTPTEQISRRIVHEHVLARELDVARHRPLVERGRAALRTAADLPRALDRDELDLVTAHEQVRAELGVTRFSDSRDHGFTFYDENDDAPDL
jgi:hypothetical protein